MLKKVNITLLGTSKTDGKNKKTKENKKTTKKKQQQKLMAIQAQY